MEQPRQLNPRLVIRANRISRLPGHLSALLDVPITPARRRVILLSFASRMPVAFSKFVLVAAAIRPVAGRVRIHTLPIPSVAPRLARGEPYAQIEVEEVRVQLVREHAVSAVRDEGLAGVLVYVFVSCMSVKNLVKKEKRIINTGGHLNRKCKEKWP